MSFAKFFKKTFSTPAVRRYIFNRSGFNKYGLYRDDLFYETPEVQEAIRRLPSEVSDARTFRILRAHQLCLSHTILPENEWTKFEDDENNRYLMPYLNEVEEEVKERKIWVKMH